MKIEFKLIGLLSITLLIYCGNPETKNQSITDDQPQNILEMSDVQVKNSSVKTGRIERRRISSILKVNGIIDVPPQNMVSISVPLGGYLTHTDLLPGMHVYKGDVIAKMEDPQFIQIQQDYLTAKAKLQFAEKEYNRQKELNLSKATSDKNLEQALSDYTSQKVLVRALSEKLLLIGLEPSKLNENNLSRNIDIHSPINGYVSKVNINIGKYAKPEDVLFEIVNPEDIHLNLMIFEKDINKLYIGQSVVAHTNSSPDKEYKCEIILIGKDFGSDRSVEVHCHFEQYDDKLIPGMFMNAEIECESRETTVLPSEAVVSFEGQHFVFRDNGNNRFEMIRVETGISESNFTEIVCTSDSTLLEENLVTHGAYWLLMQMKKDEE